MSYIKSHFQGEGHEPAWRVKLVWVRERDHADWRGEDPPGVGPQLGQRDHQPGLPGGPRVPPLPRGQGRGQDREDRHNEQHLAADQDGAAKEETLFIPLAEKS